MGMFISLLLVHDKLGDIEQRIQIQTTSVQKEVISPSEQKLKLLGI